MLVVIGYAIIKINTLLVGTHLKGVINKHKVEISTAVNAQVISQSTVQY